MSLPSLYGSRFHDVLMSHDIELAIQTPFGRAELNLQFRELDMFPIHMACRLGSIDLVHRIVMTADSPSAEIARQCTLSRKRPLAFTTTAAFKSKLVEIFGAHEHGSPFHDAIMLRQGDVVDRYLTANDPIIYTQDGGASALHLACRSGQRALAMRLIQEYGFDVFERDDTGHDPLFYLRRVKHKSPDNPFVRALLSLNEPRAIQLACDAMYSEFVHHGVSSVEYMLDYRLHSVLCHLLRSNIVSPERFPAISVSARRIHASKGVPHRVRAQFYLWCTRNNLDYAQLIASPKNVTYDRRLSFEVHTNQSFYRASAGVVVLCCGVTYNASAAESHTKLTMDLVFTFPKSRRLLILGRRCRMDQRPTFELSQDACHPNKGWAKFQNGVFSDHTSIIQTMLRLIGKHWPLA